MAEPCFGSSAAARELTEEEAATVASQVPAPAHKVYGGLRDREERNID